MRLFAPRWAFSISAILSAGFALGQDNPPVLPPLTDPTQGQDQNQDINRPPIIGLPLPKDDDSYWKRTWRWWSESVIDQVRISGYRNLGYHIEDISGDREAYELGNYGGQGGQRFTDIGFLRFTGSKVFGTIDFEVNVQDSRFQDPQAQRYKVRYSQGPWEAETGDIFTQLPTSNPFVRLGKQLSGVTVGYRGGGLQAKVVTSNARGQARTITIQGTNSAGPYFLQSSQILRGSESIQVDGVDQVFGQDYTIDYELGSLTFVNRTTLQAKIIPPTSTIVATYETFGFNGSAGKIEGLAVTYDLPGQVRVGLSALQQKSGGSGRLSTRTEKFQGFGAPSTPYFLQFEPLSTQPLIIRVDGVLQTASVDYYFDAGNPSIFYFTRFMPSTSDIDVIYTPKPTTDIQGDREAMGLDVAMPFGNNGRVSYATGIGRLTNTLTPSEGRAQALEASYGWGKWSVRGSIRDIPDGFVSVESAGFNRNERSSSLSAAYQPNPLSSLRFNHYNSSVLNRSTSGTTTNLSRTRFINSAASYSITPESENGWPLTLNLSRSTTKGVSQDSTVDKASVDTSRQFGKLTTRFSLENQRVTGSQKADLLSAVTRLAYVSGAEWLFGGEASISQIKTSDDSGFGRDYSLTAAYRPTDTFLSSFSYTDSDAGDLTGLSGFSSGFGSGFDGNGFTSGAGSSIVNGASSGKTTQLAFSWTLSERISVDGAASLYRRSGNITSNSETQAISFGGSIDFGKGHSARGSLSRSETKFIDSPLRSSSTTADFQISGSPPGRFSYGATATALLSGGTSDFQQDAFSYDVSLGYLLADRHQLGFNLNTGTIRGYYPQDELEYSLTYRYQIWEALAFNATYRVRDVTNRDPLLTSGEYRASGLSFGLAFNFFR